MHDSGEHDSGGHDSDGHFDEVVDVICAGSGPGVLAFAIACASRDQRVLVVDSVPAGELADPETVEYIQAMTEDLGPINQDFELAHTRAQPVPPPKGDRPRIEPFLGGRLRQWSATCMGSAFGVMFSDVIDTSMTPLRTKVEPIRAIPLGSYSANGDRPGPALADWLGAQAAALDVTPEADWTLRRLLFEGGRVVGAVLGTPDGPYRVRALECVAVNTVAAPAVEDWPVQAGLDAAELQVALVGRTAARFGRVELLELV